MVYGHSDNLLAGVYRLVHYQIPVLGDSLKTDKPAYLIGLVSGFLVGEKKGIKYLTMVVGLLYLLNDDEK